VLFVLIETGERTLRLPLQEDWTIRGLLDCVECVLGSRRVLQAGRNPPLHQQRIHLVAPVLILTRFGEGLIGEASGVIEFVGLLGDEGQGLESCDNVLSAFDFPGQIERSTKRLLRLAEIISINVDITERREPAGLAFDVAELFRLISSLNEHALGFLRVAEFEVGPAHVAQRLLRNSSEVSRQGDLACGIGPVQGFVKMRLLIG